MILQTTGSASGSKLDQVQLNPLPLSPEGFRQRYDTDLVAL